eukprot:scaffold7630_cov63-Phaeocystis_antarctica.AAC.1
MVVAEDALDTVVDAGAGRPVLPAEDDHRAPGEDEGSVVRVRVRVRVRGVKVSTASRPPTRRALAAPSAPARPGR